MIYRTFIDDEGRYWRIERRPRWWPFWSHVTLELTRDRAIAHIQLLKEPPVIL